MTDMEITYGGATFRVGEIVRVLQPDNRIVLAEILRFVIPHEIASVQNHEMRCSCRWLEMLKLNPLGSSK